MTADAGRVASLAVAGRNAGLKDRGAFRHTLVNAEVPIMEFLNTLRAGARWLAVTVAAVAAPVAAQVDFEPAEIFDGRTIEFPVSAEVVQAKARLARGNDKIDPALRALVAESSGLGGLAAKAQGFGVPLGASGRSAAVALTPGRGSSVDELIAAAEDRGAEVTEIFEGVVYASVPLDRIEALGDAEELHYAGRQARYYPSYPAAAAAAGRVATDGVRAIGADKLHAQGLTGQGVKVGILDFGFRHYAQLQQAGQVPEPRAVRAFNSSGRWDAESEHGTACAEIVHAMAPDAELYLAAVSGLEEQIVQAAQWLAEQGVDIVSFSGGGHLGPHDGNSQLDRLVEELTSRGILWVNAAGNEGAAHWGGLATDSDGDGWIEMGPNGENFLALRPAGDRIMLLIVWDDWGADPALPTATQDIDAFLYAYNPLTRRPVPWGRSANPQRGRGPPAEFLSVAAPRRVPYLLALRATSVARPVRVHVHAMAPAQLMPLVPDGSISIPATSTQAVAVGAVDVRSGRLEAFSSNGPTDDGRTKPDVSAPDQTRSAAYNGRFPGTSAACPHVSGFAALLKQQQPSASREELAARIARAVRPMPRGAGRPNNQYGAGHIDASKLDGVEIEVTGKVELPRPWGGAITFSELDANLKAAGSAADLGLKVAVGRQEYRVGDGLKIGVRADRECDFLLLGRDAQGNFAVIAPLGDDRTRLDAGEKRAFPERGTIRVTGPPGRDEVILIGAPDPLDARGWRSSDSISVARVSYRVVR